VSVKVEPTKEQLQVARMYGIPKSQAHTINMRKVEEYEAWKRSEGSVEVFLNRLEESRESI